MKVEVEEDVCLMHPMKVKFIPLAQENQNSETITESDKLLFNPCEDEQNQQWVMNTLLKQEADATQDETTDQGANRYTQDYQQLSCANCFTPIAFSPTHDQVDKSLEEMQQKFKATHAIKSIQGIATENVVLDQSKLI